MALLSCGGEESVSLQLVINGQTYTGPSLCAQDLLISPLCLLLCAGLLLRRLRAVWKLPQAHDYMEPSFWINTTWIDRFQLLFLVLLVVFPIICIFILDSEDPTRARQIMYYISQFLLWMFTLFVVVLELSRGLIRGAELKGAWMFMTFVLMIRVRVASLIIVFEGLNPEDSHSVADILYFVLVFSMMMLGLIQAPVLSKTTSDSQGQNQYGMFVDHDDGTASSQKTDTAWKGELTASWLSLMTFEWLTPLLVLGYKRQLSDKDLCPLIPADTMSELGRELLQAWNAELEKMKHDPKRKSPLFNSLAKVHWHDVLVGGIFKLINDLVVFIGPMLLQQLIRFVEKGGENGSIAEGAFIAIGIFLAKSVESFALNQYFHVGYRLGSQARAATTSLVYRKAFILSAKGRQDFKLGELVSLMSVDAQRLAGTAPYLHQFWSAPCQLIVSVTLLYMTVGASVFAGVAVMIILIPINMKISKKQSAINREIMKLKDKRSNKLDEVLQGIRIIKYFAWEKSFFASVSEVRNQELDLIWKNSLWGIVSMILWTGSPMIVTLVTFLVYTGTGQILTPNVAFTVLALFNVMRFPLTSFPMIINFIIECRVALKRLAKYLLAEEIDRYYYANSDTSDSAGADGVEMLRMSSQGPMIKVENGSFSWAKASEAAPSKPAAKPAGNLLTKLASIFKSEPSDDKPTIDRDAYTSVLRDINMEVTAGKLCMVCGPVGAGKSSLLGAILGETRKDEGRVWLSGKVAYAAQQPWIMNATVKENILFGSPFNEDKYAQVLAVCALKQDMEILPGGDTTEIGERGINLSGGQKARISLARTVYQDADIYILDDPLSAVDVHVSKHIFEECILGYLGNKTRLLVTHQIQYLPRSDKVLVLDKGTIAGCGTFAEVTTTHPHLIVEGTQDNEKKERSNADTPPNAKVEKKESNGPPSKASNGSSSDSQKGKEGPGRTIAAETRQKGTIPLHVWKGYMYSMTLPLVGSIIAAYIFSQLFGFLSDWELSFWSTKMVQNQQAMDEAIKSHSMLPEAEPVWTYFGLYALLTILAVLSVGVRSASVAVGCFKAAAKFHDDMLRTVIRAPVAFFDTTPTGRILNRFSSDQYSVDNDLRQNVSMLMMCILRVVSVAFVIFYVTPFFVVVVIPLGFVYLRVQKFYRESSRELKRLEAVAKSPIFAQFSETLNGVATIRSFSAQSRFTSDSDRLNDAFSRAYLSNNSSNRWLAIRLEFVGNVAVGCASLFAILWNGSDSAAAGMVGLSVTYALDVTGTLNWAIRTFTQLESNMVAVERLEEYTQLKTEKPEVIESDRPPENWPQQGVLSFEDVEMRYREELDLALKGITFTTNPGEKVGVVGRTGAGKSSLAVALFRICELCGGKIVLDGVDVSRIGLTDLRSRLSIIPQDPILFAGTVRSNLDPFDEFNQADLWEALEKVHLKEFFREKDEGLGYAITEGGANLSVGQRQLMCMARALLRKAKVIIMDEATASVDMQTDAAIQETVREGFKASTVITIAHRLATVMACDRIMVLGEGRVLEMGSPAELSGNPTSVFRAMTQNSESAAEMLK